jgi:hypothetical protein
MIKAIGWLLAVIFYILVSIPLALLVYGIAYIFFTIKNIYDYARTL